MHELINTFVNFASDLWYTWIFIMMLLEWTVFPMPSELVMIPAWYLASTWEMDFTIALIVWTFWAVTWATINYIVWYYLWRKAIHKLISKYWKYVLATVEHYDKTEKYFNKHWSITTFLARFIPVIRHLISIPAWVFKMDFTKFFMYTAIWACMWNIMLMVIWYIAWENKELITKYSQEILMYSTLVIIIIANIYYYLNKKKNAEL
jgi:membrane protein DedA with SNARE-associated domain